MYRRERAVEEEQFPRRRRTPSFSSSLLDAIYRSIDESKGEEQDLGYITQKKQSSTGNGFREEEKEICNLRRAIMIESWVEKQSIHNSSSSVLSNSASSSSESSSGAPCSSSETESSFKQRSQRSSNKNPLRKNGVNPSQSEKHARFELKKKNSEKQKQSPKRDGNNGGGGFTKTKLRALKIYGELKKVKQPISPGGRIATFLNSIFNSGNVKKAKMCYVGAVEDVSSEHVSKSACSVSLSSSAASTFSRPCLSSSKTPSSCSRSKLRNNNGVKRTVRFYPVSVILGEDSQPCGQKRVYEEDPSLLPLPTFRNFVTNSSLKSDFKNLVNEKNRNNGFCDGDDDDEDEDEDDAESYSSSDLFELDHLVGIGRYREELPVYETTNIKTNQAIAKGLIL